MSKKTDLTRHDIIDMSQHVAKVPTKVLTATRGNTTIVTKLYGKLNDVRTAAEQFIADHRAEQLNPVPKRPERIYREPIAAERYIDAEEQHKRRRVR
jgi:hypothetical protein